MKENILIEFLCGLGARRRRPAGRVDPAALESSLAFAVATPFLEDDRFERAYAAGKATGSWWNVDVRWRASLVCWAARHGASIEGDFVECGVHRGGYARMVLDYVDFPALSGKRFFLVDTFQGIPRRYLKGSASVFETVYDDCFDDVVRTFADHPRVEIVRGEVPGVLPAVTPDRVAFLSIDLNTADPSAAALEHFWPRLSVGAIAVLDDYNFEHFADQRSALDAAAARLGAQILALPTGQGLLVKHCGMAVG